MRAARNAWQAAVAPALDPHRVVFVDETAANTTMDRRYGYPEGHRMSTYEAVAQALAVLEGEAVAGPLLDFYRRAVDRMLLVRGHLKPGDVYGGLAGP